MAVATSANDLLKLMTTPFFAQLSQAQAGG
jgi:hypothetical protein